MSQSNDEIQPLQGSASLTQGGLEKSERESLKKEIVAELKAASEKKNIAQQVLMLILGFALTGIVGSWLASYWKDKEWSNQQSQLSRQHQIEQKYAITDKVTKGVAEAYVGVEDILHLAEYGWYDPIPGEKAPQRDVSWLQTSRNWRVNEEMLQNDIATNFRTADAQLVFAQIKDDWDRINNSITFIRKLLVRKKWKKLERGDKVNVRDLSDGVERIESARKRLREMAGRTKDLIRILMDEIQADIGSPDLAMPKTQ